MYLACLGLDSGAHFLRHACRTAGTCLDFARSSAFTVVPTIIVGIMAMRWFKFNFGETCGMLCGAAGQPDGAHLCLRQHQGRRAGGELCHRLSFGHVCARDYRAAAHPYAVGT